MMSVEDMKLIKLKKRDYFFMDTQEEWMNRDSREVYGNGNSREDENEDDQQGRCQREWETERKKSKMEEGDWMKSFQKETSSRKSVINF